MRHRVRLIPAYLTQLIPLGLLVWLGSAEMSAGRERASKELQAHALTFLRDARRELDRQVQAICEQRLARDFDLVSEQPVHVARALTEADPAVRGIVVLGREAEILFPRVASPFTLPLHRNPHSALARAEAHEWNGDAEAAAAAYRTFLDEADRRTGSEDRYRAWFALGGLARRAGELDRAEDHYLEALAAANRMSVRGWNDFHHRELLLLFCEVALAELAAQRDGSLHETVALLRSISGGEYHLIADQLLTKIVERLERRVPEDAAARADVDDALETERVRVDGREFAREYDALLEETVRRRLRAAERPDDEIVYQVQNSQNMRSLLAIRRLRPDESRQLSFLRQPTWIGLRLDLDRVLEDSVGELISPTDDSFRLELADLDGTPIAPAADPDSEPLTDPTTLRSEVGFQLRAIPVDAESYLASQRRSLQNQALLVLALCLLAGGGAFLLVRSVAREAELAALKVDLVSRVSHELKTPLALIKMYSETIGLGRAKSEDQVEQFAGIISRESDHLTRMIERVLDFSSQEAGTLAYRRVPTDLSELVADVTDQYRPHVESKNLRLETRVAPGITADVDPGATVSAVMNLLENSVKYCRNNPDSTIEVELRRAGDRAVIEVADRGIGVPKGELSQVFESFFRASNAVDTRGAGLGLSLVKHFAEAHDGGINLLRRTDGGTIARLVLPVAGAEERERGPE